ncbi:protein FAM98C [Callorhinchus milii]|uniref:protein FAM98C n=1 Tax=Callorhinchus milii TaxID=7868 RepID=UPI001C3F9E21|nr:protein FAM98C [Callorhinchus milii]
MEVTAAALSDLGDVSAGGEWAAGRAACPYPSLTTGPVTARLTNKETCLQLLGFLSSELQAARCLYGRQSPAPREGEVEEGGDVDCELRSLFTDLGLAQPSPRTSLSQLLTQLTAKVSEVVAEQDVGAALLTCSLEPAQWERLEVIGEVLGKDYECRKQMLLHRLDLTIQSFRWSPRAEERRAAVRSVYEPLRRELSARSHVTLAHVLAARHDLSIVTKTTSLASRKHTACAINKVVMGAVPDRGGRPSDLERPMPTWDGPRGEGGRKRNKQKRGKGHKQP